MLVRITKAVPPYNSGETAEFPEAKARRLIELGAAEEVAPAGYSVAAAVPDKKAVVAPTRAATRRSKRKRGA